MNAGELFEHFRGDVFDTKTPYLWSDDEVWRYMLDAYRMFLRLTGGVADFSSEATQVAVSTGEASADLHPSVLRIMSAYRESDGNDVKIINQTDIVAKAIDYGPLVRNINKPVPGAINEMVIGKQKDTVYFAALPTTDDTIQMSIYRTCLVTELNEDSKFDDMDDDHVIHLTAWMKRCAFKKDDVEIQNLPKSQEYEAEFRAYCEQVKSELARKQHKTRVVAYGGL